MRQSYRYRHPIIFLTLLLIGVITEPLRSQSGCTDPQATNFDPTATINDGSCIYPPTSYELTEVTELGPELQETSGLAYVSNQLWTHNDGGNPDEIYRIDALSGAIQQTVIIATADNQDWEDLAQDEEYLYVGDFGNNNGDRQNLRIYRISRTNLVSGIVNADLIEFAYEDQDDFTTTPFQTNFDCEAFFVAGDSLHLFTKRWADFKTYHYVLPKTPGTHEARLADSLDVQLLLTAADRSENGTVLLLGWNPITGNAAMWMLFDYPDHQFFAGNKRRINLGFASTNSQPEGIVFGGPGNGWISSENYLNYPQRLLSFDISQWLSGGVNTSETVPITDVSVFPNPGSGEVCIEHPAGKTPDRIRWYDATGRLCTEYKEPGTTCTNPPLDPGWYQIEVRYGSQYVRQVYLRF